MSIQYTLCTDANDVTDKAKHIKHEQSSECVITNTYRVHSSRMIFSTEHTYTWSIADRRMSHEWLQTWIYVHTNLLQPKTCQLMSLYSILF